MWLLIVFFFGCSDGGRAIQVVEFSSKDACMAAGNQILALDIRSCYNSPSVKATCVAKN